MGIGYFVCFFFLPECSDYREIDFYTPQSFQAIQVQHLFGLVGIDKSGMPSREILEASE